MIMYILILFFYCYYCLGYNVVYIHTQSWSTVTRLEFWPAGNTYNQHKHNSSQNNVLRKLYWDAKNVIITVRRVYS